VSESFDPVSYLLGLDVSRFLLGITGCPGAGKSTFAARLAADLGPSAIVLPMDGFHYTNSRLDDLSLRHRKGAPDTYDVPAFLELLQQVRTSTETVFAPAYSRITHEPEAGAIAVTCAHRFILVEGNYLLVESEPWGDVAAQLDETWFLDVTQEVAAQRLVRRHVSVGRTREEGEAKVRSVDMPNGEIVLASRNRADRWFTP
jgi:pantothenate kinase